MSFSRLFRLLLPPRHGRPNPSETLETEGPVVIVGANGSGKTRLGNWIEDKQPKQVHRIAAQKSLTFPQSIRPPSIEQAHHRLLFGYDDYKSTASHKHNRWGSHPATGLLNDYEHLLNYLFAEEAERNAAFKREAKSSSVRVEPPETKLDTIKHIWENTLPERELIIGGGKVEARKRSTGGAPFNASEMSDGERVVFYLAGQALSAPLGATLVIDEPELHLHRGIQTRLWDEIEAERTDCLFVYLTHDLEFAASRIGATKVWIREFDGKTWDWEVIPAADSLPEPLLLRVLGSRKNVLFIEGVSGGIDEEVYTHVYPNWSVTPCGSCEHVIHATGVYSAMSSFHHLACRGLIDDDERTPSEVAALQNAGIHLLGFAEIENIFLTSDVLKIAAEALMPGEDVASLLAKAHTKVLAFLAAERERVISRRVARHLQEAARHFQTKAIGEPAIVADWDALHHSHSPVAIYVHEAQRVDAVIAANDYEGALRVYPNKGLSQQITSLFGSINLQRYLRKLLAAPNDRGLRAVIQKNLPQLA